MSPQESIASVLSGFWEDRRLYRRKIGALPWLGEAVPTANVVQIAHNHPPPQ
jgi:hypothetical protein